MAWYNWSQTASANASADPAINWAEGQAPSSVNDSARAMMAVTALYRDDVAGAIVTAGSSTAYTISSFSDFDTLTHLNAQMIAFTPHATNGATVTLNVDGLGAKPLRSSPSVELLAGTIIQGTPYVAVYNNSDGAFYLRGFMGNPYNVPLLGGMDFWDTITPNSSFIFPAGQAISRTTYATAFARWGTTYGVGDGSTTFNVPDKTGRVSAMKEATGTRLTTAGSGVDGGTIGSAGGLQDITLAQSALPNVTLPLTGTPQTVNTNQSGIASSIASAITVQSGPGSQVLPGSGIILGALSVTFTPGGNSPLNGGVTQTTVNNVPPLIVCNYIIRII